MSIKLTDTLIVMLSAAAQRDDRCLIAPQILKDSATQKLATKLIGAGLAKEIKAKPGAPAWRRDEQADQPYALKLTAAGAKTFAIDDGSASNETREDISQHLQGAAPSSEIVQRAVPDVAAAEPPSPSAPRGGTKLFQRDHGATLDELVQTTGWLSHTTRAALTGLRKRGYTVTIDRSDKERGSTYHARSDETVDVVQARSQSGGSLAISAPKSKKARRGEKPQAQQVA